MDSYTGGSFAQGLSNSQNPYWAATAPSELVGHLNRCVSSYYLFITRYSLLDKFKRSYLAYYGLAESGADSSKMNQAGTNGELYLVKVNHYRSLLQNILSLTTAQRPALQPKAQNTDSKSMNQTVLARSVLDYYLSEKRLEVQLKKACEFAIIAGEGFITSDWNATAGDIYTVAPNGVPIYNGDVEFNTYHPIDVIRECWSENHGKNDWYIIRRFCNKYDLAAKYPEMSKDILAVTKSPDYFTRYTFLTFDALNNEDYVPVYTFYHRPTDALPNGRQFQFIDNTVWFGDGPLAYKNMPVYRIASAEMHGTPFGYTVAYDLLGLQKNYDALFSVVTTNQMNYGIQNICGARGNEINVVQLAQGLNYIEYSPNLGKPEPLNLVQTPPEIFQQLDRIEKTMELISGVNSVARGNPESSLHSGSALALVASQAVQFNSGLAASYNRLLEDVGTGLIEILQEYASTPRIAQIAGKSNRTRIQEFKGEDLIGINRVTVEAINPISNTAGGRLQEAQDLLNSKLITNPAHYFEVLATGTIDSMYESELSEVLNIRAENEDLANGQVPPVVFSDNHVNHIKEHGSVLASPQARANPTIVNAVQQHVQDHINQLRTCDPQLLMVLGQQPLPPQNAPQPPTPPVPPPGDPGGGPPPGGQPPQNSAVKPGIQNPTPPLQQAAAGAHPANMPKLPPGAPAGAQQAMTTMAGNIAAGGGGGMPPHGSGGGGHP